jgi:hypothetical protein
MYLFTMIFFVLFLFGCYRLHYLVYNGMKPKYPEMPSDGKPDIYYMAAYLDPYMRMSDGIRGFQEKA